MLRDVCAACDGYGRGFERAAALAAPLRTLAAHRTFPGMAETRQTVSVDDVTGS